MLGSSVLWIIQNSDARAPCRILRTLRTLRALRTVCGAPAHPAEPMGSDADPPMRTASLLHCIGPFKAPIRTASFVHSRTVPRLKNRSCTP